jgi:hypothetical protein
LAINGSQHLVSLLQAATIGTADDMNVFEGASLRFALKMSQSGNLYLLTRSSNGCRPLGSPGIYSLSSPTTTTRQLLDNSSTTTRQLLAVAISLALTCAYNVNLDDCHQTLLLAGYADMLPLREHTSVNVVDELGEAIDAISG